MSKAFTKEDGGSDEPLPVRPRAASGEKRPITPEGHRALEAELAALTAPSDTDAQGSLEAEARTQERTRRARQLAMILEDVQVVRAERQDDARVAFGAWVTLEDESGAEVTYRLVGPDEMDVKQGRISVESPIARALLGRAEGDEVVVERPRGAAEYTITRVRYEPPEA